MSTNSGSISTCQFAGDMQVSKDTEHENYTGGGWATSVCVAKDRRKTMTLFMAVTNDDYELPIAVETSC